MGAAFLDYLDALAGDLPESLACAGAARFGARGDPRDVLRQVRRELALPRGKDDEDAAGLFRPLAHHADADACDGKRPRRPTQMPGSAKGLALRGEVGPFLPRAADLLRLGRLAQLALWFATVIEVAGVCRSCGRGRRLANRMLAEASGMLMPPGRCMRGECRADGAGGR